MHLSAKEDIEIPIDALFGRLTDFARFEKMALRRGVEVRRKPGQDSGGVGTQWETQFAFRGRERTAHVTLVRMEEPTSLGFEARIDGLSAEVSVELVALSRQRSRLTVDVDLHPKTLSARLLVQSLKLAKGKIDKRFRKRVAGFASVLENGTA